MSKTNYSTMAFLADDNVIAVKAVFTEDDYNGNRTPNPKEYTYKTTLGDLKKDDLVVVECAGPSNYFGFCVVKITEVNTEVDFAPEFNYKWIVGKVNTEDLEATKKAEAKLIRKLRSMEMKAKKDSFKKILGLEGMTIPKLSDFRK